MYIVKEALGDCIGKQASTANTSPLQHTRFFAQATALESSRPTVVTARTSLTYVAFADQRSRALVSASCQVCILIGVGRIVLIL